MYGVSAAFITALAQSHTMAVKADVYRAGTLVAQDLTVTGGQVDIDRSAASRRRCSVTVVDSTGALIPTGSSSTLAPYGNEIKLYRGIALSSGTEYVPLGVFRISDSPVADDGSQSVTISGYDRGRALSRARFDTPFTIAAGTNYVTAIRAVIDSQLSGQTYSAMTTTATTPLLVFDQSADPMATVIDMANSFGAEIYFDANGTVVIQPQPVLSSQASVATFVDGTNATILSVTNNLSDDPGYNGYVVDGEAPGSAPVHSAAWDTDPSSPTYYLGAYGKVPEFYRSEFITTQAQADAAALAGLQANKGGTEDIQFTATPNPALDVADVVRVTRSKIGVDDFYGIESLTIPLDPGTAMTVTTRKRRV